ncbi:L-aspartate oxidase [Desulfosediminicola sp.]|uniref:L-aspartate oxidase n=1 Tax=Desulfosediminicola sp. TaxID=2886825 RepID=UPI003AF29BAA
MDSDYLIIGTGIAGLSFALRAAKKGSVKLITKKEEIACATNLAQGGIAAVLSEDDSFELHIQDTLISGDGLCDREVVRIVVEEGPERIQELIEIGVGFVKKEGEKRDLDLGKEGGHSRRRVAHAYDLTGREIERALLAEAKRHSNIEILENCQCIDLITHGRETKKKCIGAFVLTEGEVKEFRAKITVLCTGGVGKVYLYTTNPDIATGDGVAMAFRAGAKIANMEFIQFHPTCLYHHQTKNFLISEAVRGEGAFLVNSKGERFMAKYDPKRMELATRDTVARAIDSEMKKSGDDCVYLDITHKDPEFIKNRFPTIYGKCKELGIDVTRMPIPVVPAAHYLCGGVLTDTSGCTSISNLLALGETACTGLHGANRLASNSLLEAVVFAKRAADYCDSLELNHSDSTPLDRPQWMDNRGKLLDEAILINNNWDILRRVMWNYVGIVRNSRRLDLASKRVVEIAREIETLYKEYKVSAEMIELRNIAIVSQLIIEAAKARTTSQGLHFLQDENPRNDDDTSNHWNVFSRKINYADYPWQSEKIETIEV